MRIVDVNDANVMAQALRTIRTLESGGNYQSYAKGQMKGTASGAYAMLDTTWQHYAASIPGANTYRRAKDAPSYMQDAVAMVMLRETLTRYHGDLEAVPAVWYTGRYDPATLDVVPKPEFGNRATVREYQKKWLNVFDGGKSTAKPGSVAAYTSWNEGTKIPDYLFTYGAGKLDKGVMIDIGQGKRLAPEPAKAFAKLKAAATAAGFNVNVTDAYRSFAAQEAEFFKRYTPVGQTHGDRYYQGQWWNKRPGVAQLATPGQSVHNFGYALDIFDQSKAKTPAFHAWLAQHAQEFGFKNTVSSEAWHIAYQGAGDAGSIASAPTPTGTKADDPFALQLGSPTFSNIVDLGGARFVTTGSDTTQDESDVVEVQGAKFIAPNRSTTRVSI